MNESTSTTAHFGDGEYKLWLSPMAIFQMEMGFKKLHRGQTRSILAVYDDLLSCFSIGEGGTLKLIGASPILVDEINEVLRNALEGGNDGPEERDSADVDADRAARLVRRYGIPHRPIEEVAAVAFKALHALIYGAKSASALVPPRAAE